MLVELGVAAAAAAASLEVKLRYQCRHKHVKDTACSCSSGQRHSPYSHMHVKDAACSHPCESYWAWARSHRRKPHMDPLAPRMESQATAHPFLGPAHRTGPVQSTHSCTGRGRPARLGRLHDAVASLRRGVARSYLRRGV